MDVPDLVEGELGGESVLVSVGIGGDDGVFLAPERTLVYRGEGLLSDESVSTHEHGFDRLELSEGRRRTSFTLHYYDREESFAVGSSHAQDVLRALLAAHLRSTGALKEDEQVRGVYRFDELTLVVGTERLLKHVGGAVWSAEYESFPYAGLTRLEFEEGNHALQVVIAVEQRPERIKVHNDRAPEVRRTVEQAIFAFHDVDSLPALNEAVAPEEPDEESAPAENDYADSGIDSLLDDEPAGSAGSTGSTAAGDTTTAATTTDTASGTADADATTATDDAATDTAGADAATTADSDTDGFVSATDKAVLTRLKTLEEKVDEQTTLIERQQETIEQLVDELRRGR